MTPLLASINLLARLTKLRKPIYPLDYWFVINGYNLGIAKWKRCTGKRARSFHALYSTPHSSNILGSLTWKLPEPHSFGFYRGSITQAWQSKSLGIGYWFNLQPLSPPWGSGGGAEPSNLLIMHWLPWQPVPSTGYLGSFQKSPNINWGVLKGACCELPNTHHSSFLALITYETLRVLGALC